MKKCTTYGSNSIKPTKNLLEGRQMPTSANPNAGYWTGWLVPNDNNNKKSKRPTVKRGEDAHMKKTTLSFTSTPHITFVIQKIRGVHKQSFLLTVAPLLILVLQALWVITTALINLRMRTILDLFNHFSLSLLTLFIYTRYKHEDQFNWRRRCPIMDLLTRLTFFQVKMVLLAGGTACP